MGMEFKIKNFPLGSNKLEGKSCAKASHCQVGELLNFGIRWLDTDCNALMNIWNATKAFQIPILFSQKSQHFELLAIKLMHT
jgi:hypothetical protein